MTNDETTRLIEEALNTWSSHPNARAEDEKRAATALEVVKAALTALPEDVERDVTLIRRELEEGGADYAPHLASLSRLASAAARVPGLEAELEQVKRVGNEAAAHWKGLADSWQEATGNAEARANTAESERDALTARVAELERERDEAMATGAELDRTARANHAKWTAAEARATAAEADNAVLLSLVRRAIYGKADRSCTECGKKDGCDEGCAMARAAAAHHPGSALLEELERLRAKSAPTPAPRLREAAVEARTVLGCSSAFTDSVRLGAVRKLDAALAAYDATPPADTNAPFEAVRCPSCEGRGYPGEIGCGRGGQGSCPDCKGTGRDLDATEPAVTHADLAAVVEEVVSDAVGVTGGKAPSPASFIAGAREVLRRVTDGQVPRVLLEARVVEVLSDICAASDGRSDYAAGWGACVSNVRARLGLTLPTGPGGGEPNSPETPDGSTDPEMERILCMSDTEVDAELTKAGVDVAAFEERTRAHVAKVRASLPPDSPYFKAEPAHAPESRNPHVTPEVPALASKEVPTGTLVPVSPSFVKLTAPSTAYVKGDGCDVCDFQPAGKLHKWHCVYRDPCHYEDSEGREVHDAQPAAPEVLMEFTTEGYAKEHMRVLASGALEYEARPNMWIPSVNAAGNVLARALAEAKREIVKIHEWDRDAQKAAAHTAAEDMRERAALALLAKRDAFPTNVSTKTSGIRGGLEMGATIVRSLPLEDK